MMIACGGIVVKSDQDTQLRYRQAWPAGLWAVAQGSFAGPGAGWIRRPAPLRPHRLELGLQNAAREGTQRSQ